MKIRMIEGHYGREEMGKDSDYFLEPVAFPMEQTIPNFTDQGEQTVDITTEEELADWAKEIFTDFEIWNMDVSLSACIDPELSYDLENATERLQREAYDLCNDSLEAEVVQSYYQEAEQLREKAGVLAPTRV